jgi:hypothetical protein
MSLPLAIAGKIDEAIEASERCNQLMTEINPLYLAILGVVYSLSPPRRKDAHLVIDKLKKLSLKRQISPFFMGMIFTGLDKKDQAFEWYEKSYIEREPLLMWIKTDPIIYDRLNSDPRYIKLTKELGLEK